MDLPEYVSQHLERSPLVLVAAQISFEEVGREVTHEQARRVQRIMGSDWSQLQSAPLMQTTVTPVGAVNEPNRQAYRLTTKDTAWSILLNPNSAAIETRAYSRWDEFSGVLEALSGAVAEVFDPATEQRLGVRYIDQIPLPEGHSDWSKLVHESLLGLTADARFAGSVLASDQRVMLQLDEEARCVLRHGLLPDPESGAVGQTYLLDFDVFRENRAFDPDSVMRGGETLHHFVGRLFMACITDDLYRWLKG